LTIVAEQQLLEAFALPINLVVITLTVTLAALAAAVLVGLRVVRQVVRPVQDLAATARAIRSGDFEQQAPVARDDEVGELAAAFNSMTAQLRDFIGALEQRVQERTAELQKAKAAADAAREAADAANRAKSEFLSSMSHELRTPLNGILGYAQILQRERALTPRQAEGLTIIQQSGEHLLTLINDILDLAKIEARKLELYPAPIHLNGFLQGLVGIAEARAEQKGLAFAYEALTPIPVGVIADDKRLRQILLNLLGNAVKFTDAGRVALRVSARADTAPPDHVALRFEVEDTGPGIPADQLESIFLPFEQTEATRGKIEGTGLGLPISRQFARLMGSDIHVESRPGQGSLFWLEIVLPVAAPLGETRRANEPVIVGYRGPRRKVLVADDKDYNRAVLVDLLAPLGFETLTASDGREAVARARDFKPDVILTDMVMPVMTGVEAAQHIRQIPELRQTVIVAISASVLNVEQQRQQLAGCDGYLPKPVRAEDLYDLLARLLNLEWVREGAAVAAPPPTLPAAPGGEPVALPPAERAALAELARRGDMLKLEQRAAQLAQARPELAPFARELERLARRFEDQQALALIEHCPEAPA
jgi:signal transduction histidine kinase/DNA-binding response OmpR family regulator